MAEVDEQDTFMTGTTMSAEDEKAQRLRASLSAADPEDALKRPADALLGSMGDALAHVVQEAAQQQEAAARKKTQGIEEGSEEHWNLVMKKLAPTGYKKSPQWQKSIIDRVIKKMAGRAKEGTGNPLTQGPSKDRSAVDLAAIGLNADMASTVTADEKRFSSSMKSMSPGRSHMASSGTVTKKPEPDMSEKLVQEQSNKVHFYIRAIQASSSCSRTWTLTSAR